MAKAIVVKKYKSEKEMQRGINKMLSRGYEVQDTQVSQPKRGMMTRILFGLFLLFAPKKQEFVVTYRYVGN